MKYIPLASILFLTIFSCQKSDESPVTLETTTVVRVMKIESTYENGTDENLDFTYRADGLVSQFVVSGNYRPGFTATFGYSDKKLNSLLYSNGHLRTYTYSGDLIVSRINTTQPVSRHEYIYNSSNQMIREKVFINDVLHCEEFYNFNNQGNITFHNNECTSQMTEFEYDSNKNPEQLIYPESYLKIYKFTTNNSTGIRIAGNTQNDSNSNYEYNADGYPTKVYNYIAGNLWETSVYTYQTITLTP